MALLRLSVFTGDNEYAQKAEASIQALIQHMEQAPSAVTSWLSAVDFLRSGSQEVVLIGDQTDAVMIEMKRELLKSFSPNTILAGANGGTSDGVKSPLLDGREQLNGQATRDSDSLEACSSAASFVARESALRSIRSRTIARPTPAMVPATPIITNKGPAVALHIY